MKYVFSLLFSVLWLVLSQAPADAQAFEKGLAAARAGDFAAAIAEWRPLAEDDHVEAQYNLGAVLEVGLGVPEDPGEAAGWYALAAGKGHARAQYNLGMMYADGRGVLRDDSRAATWLRKAAEQNHGKAQYNLAVLYQSGRGLPKDLAQAQVWFDRAAANGVTPPDAGDSDPAGESDSLDPQPGTTDANSEGPSATERVEPRPLDNEMQLSDLESGPTAVKSVGLNLDEADLPDPAASTAAAVPEPDPEPEPEPDEGPVYASLPAEPLRIAANFPEGARYRLEVTETRQRARDGGFVMAQTSQMDIDMVVKSGPGDGALIEWTFGPATVKSAGDPNAARMASELGRLIDGQVVAYHTNRNGEVTELGNPDELSLFYEETIDQVLDGIGVPAAEPQLADDIRANLAPLLSGDLAATRALELPKLLHFFSGLELAPGKTYSRTGVMSLPPSAEALPSTLEYELKWFDRTAGVAWLQWSQSVDPEQAASAVKAYAETWAAQSGQPPLEDFDIVAIDVSDSADYEIDLATGFPRQVIYIRKVELFGYSQIEKRRIRVIQ